MSNIHELIAKQRSTAWYENRFGKLTASGMQPMMSKKWMTNTGSGSTIDRLVDERCGEPIGDDDVPQTAAVRNGITYEKFLMDMLSRTSLTEFIKDSKSLARHRYQMASQCLVLGIEGVHFLAGYIGDFELPDDQKNISDEVLLEIHENADKSGFDILQFDDVVCVYHYYKPPADMLDELRTRIGEVLDLIDERVGEMEDF